MQSHNFSHDSHISSRLGRQWPSSLRGPWLEAIPTHPSLMIQTSCSAIYHDVYQIFHHVNEHAHSNQIQEASHLHQPSSQAISTISTLDHLQDIGSPKVWMVPSVNLNSWVSRCLESSWSKRRKASRIWHHSKVRDSREGEKEILSDMKWVWLMCWNVMGRITLPLAENYLYYFLPKP